MTDELPITDTPTDTPLVQEVPVDVPVEIIEPTPEPAVPVAIDSVADVKQFTETDVATGKTQYSIPLIGGTLIPLNLETTDEPLICVIKKVNELVLAINELSTR